MAVHYVYRGINHTLRRIYYGVSIDPDYRVSGSHCTGGTKTLSDWRCGRVRVKDQIEWQIIAEFDTQPEASTYAHGMEKKRCPPGCAGYIIYQTAGK